jgi:hypothetical protein
VPTGGFFLTEKKGGVNIRAPVNTMIWHKSRNVPVVGIPSSGGGTFGKVTLHTICHISLLNISFAFQSNNDPQYTIPLYQGYLPASTLKIGPERHFIYTGNKDNKSETQNQYMLFDDLKKRLEKGCETVYKEDWIKLRNGERPFDVWNAKGTLIKEENNFLGSISKNLDGDDWLVALFRLYCGM